MLQVLKDAKAIDDKYAAGEDIKPLCGMAFTVKDNLDVIGIAPPKMSMPARVFLKLVQRATYPGPSNVTAHAGDLCHVYAGYPTEAGTPALQGEPCNKACCLSSMVTSPQTPGIDANAGILLATTFHS